MKRRDDDIVSRKHTARPDASAHRSIDADDIRNDDGGLSDHDGTHALKASCTPSAGRSPCGETGHCQTSAAMPITAAPAWIIAETSFRHAPGFADLQGVRTFSPVKTDKIGARAYFQSSAPAEQATWIFGGEPKGDGERYFRHGGRDRNIGAKRQARTGKIWRRQC